MPNGCVAPARASVKVLELLRPYVKIKTDKNNVCEGELITISVADIGNTGPNAIKQWYVNDIAVAYNTDFIATDTLHKTARVRLVVTPTAACVGAFAGRRRFGFESGTLRIAKRSIASRTW
ncbi:MAG: hypothetical protein IPO21_10100 [Bacteroidales bacterium]|nr:hypothetical protein [Bacteroidales bacterium]